MTIDGVKLREMRIRKGMSQEKLGLLSNLNKRTIQRAEKGDPVSLETVAFIADALEVDSQLLKAKQLELFDKTLPLPESERGEVILVPVTRGSRLVNTLNASFYATFEYDAEPMDDTVDLLEEIAVVLNSSWSNPWEQPDFSVDGGAGDAEKIRLQARANRVLQGLDEKGITLFLGTYESWVQLPSYDPDEGVMSVRLTQEKEKVTNAILVVADEQSRHLSRMPQDHEVNTEPRRMEPLDYSQDFEDEIPF